MNGTPKLPYGWAPNTNVAAVIAEIDKRVERLQELDKRVAWPVEERERKFIYAHIAQLIKTGHS